MSDLSSNIPLKYSHESRLEAAVWICPLRQVSSGGCHSALQISAGQSDSSPTSSSDESTAAQIVESDLSGLESGTSATGRRLLKEDFRTEKQKSAIHKAEPDPARVAGMHSLLIYIEQCQ